VMVENIQSAWQAARTAHYRNALPLAISSLAGNRHLFKVEFDVVTHEQVKEAVAIIVNPGASGPPADAFFPQACLFGHVRKRAVAIVVPQNVMTPVRAKQIVPAIVVVVAHTNAGAPRGAGQSGFFCNVGERAIAIV